jgi:hypothetical protein
VQSTSSASASLASTNHLIVSSERSLSLENPVSVYRVCVTSSSACTVAVIFVSSSCTDPTPHTDARLLCGGRVCSGVAESMREHSVLAMRSKLLSFRQFEKVPKRLEWAHSAVFVANLKETKGRKVYIHKSYESRT